MPLPHSAVLRVRPIFEPITALPFHSVMGVLVLIPELYCDLVVGECEELLAETIALLLLPFFRQHVLYRSGSGEKRGTVPPDAVWRICLGDCCRIPT